MKRKNILLGILPIILAIFALQSCTKEDNTTFTTYAAFITPTVVAPLNGTLVKITGTTVDLKWATTDADNDAILDNVYFGTSATPPLYKTANTTLNLTVPVQEGVTYYWFVKMKDAKGVMTDSPIWSFSIAVNYNISNFVGLFDCNEPGYKHYDVNLTKISDTSIESDNFWDSGWAVQYVFDDYGNVNITPVSYISGKITYDITGTGKFNNTAKSFFVDYVVKNHATGATVDSNTHTFVKK